VAATEAVFNSLSVCLKGCTGDGIEVMKIAFTLHFYEELNSVTFPDLIIIISGFGIYGAAVVPDSGVGNTWQRLTLLCAQCPPITGQFLI